ncbi:hypothetical protein Hdeb2414_s0005g00165711 [Helianthus debilis subsp. tardiflorus]
MSLPSLSLSLIILSASLSLLMLKMKKVDIFKKALSSLVLV